MNDAAHEARFDVVLHPLVAAARAGAEAGTQQVLVETKRVKIANMLTANSADVEQRIKEGFNALLMNGPQADEAIKIGRAAAGR